jgi:hypothetical protein
MLKVLIRLFIDAALVAVAYSANPVLMRDRAGLPTHRDQRVSDRFLVLAVLAAGFLGVPTVAGLDRFHLHLLPNPPRAVGAAGLLLFTVGWALKGWALRTNAFATAPA